jgi:hypothetical protein
MLHFLNCLVQENRVYIHFILFQNIVKRMKNKLITQLLQWKFYLSYLNNFCQRVKPHLMMICRWTTLSHPSSSIQIESMTSSCNTIFGSIRISVTTLLVTRQREFKLTMMELESTCKLCYSLLLQNMSAYL